MNRNHTRIAFFCILIILLKSLSLAGQPFRIFAVSDLVRVFEDGYKLPVQYDTLNIFGIRGEVISGQFVVDAKNDLTGVSIEPTSISHRISGVSLPGDNIEFAFVGSIFLPVNSPNQPPDAVVRPAPARFPDYLLAEKQLDIVRGKYQSVWLTLKIPKNAAPGIYDGVVTVKCQQGKKSLPVKMNVYPLSLTPERHLKIAVRYSVNEFKKYHGIEEKYSERWFAMLRKYAENMVEHRQNVLQAPMNVIEIVRSENGELRFDFTRFDQIVQVFMNTGKMDFLETGYGLTRFRNGDWFSTVIELSDFPVKNSVSGEVITLSGKEVIPSLLPAFESHLRQKGWLDKTLLSVRNEPSLHNAASYDEISDYFHQLAPDIKQFESIETTMYGGLDIPGPKLDHLATWYDSYRAAQEKGKEICYYIVGIYQGSRYPNMTIDVPVMDSRIMPWLNYKYSLSGIKHWGWNSWTDDPYNNVGQHLGDGWHVYPVKDGVLNSLRWEEMRNGIQEYEYLWMLEDKIKTLKDSLGTRFSWIDPKQRGKELAGRVIFGFADRTNDPEVFYDAKLAIIKEITDMDAAPGLCVQTNPYENSTLTSGSSVEVLGWTEPGTKITVNGIELPVSNEGMFLEKFILSASDHSIKVEAAGSKGLKNIIRDFKIR